jgi:hypothetical protein
VLCAVQNESELGGFFFRSGIRDVSASSGVTIYNMHPRLKLSTTPDLQF